MAGRSPGPSNGLLDAMMSDLGTMRLEELPMEDGGHNYMPRNVHGPVARTPNRATNNAEANRWRAAYEEGVFNDKDAEDVKGLDDLGGGRSYADRRGDSGTPSHPELHSRTARFHRDSGREIPPNRLLKQTQRLTVSPLGIVQIAGDTPIMSIKPGGTGNLRQNTSPVAPKNRSAHGGVLRSVTNGARSVTNGQTSARHPNGGVQQHHKPGHVAPRNGPPAQRNPKNNVYEGGILYLTQDPAQKETPGTVTLSKAAVPNRGFFRIFVLSNMIAEQPLCFWDAYQASNTSQVLIAYFRDPKDQGKKKHQYIMKFSTPVDVREFLRVVSRLRSGGDVPLIQVKAPAVTSSSSRSRPEQIQNERGIAASYWQTNLSTDSNFDPFSVSYAAARAEATPAQAQVATASNKAKSVKSNSTNVPATEQLQAQPLPSTDPSPSVNPAPGFTSSNNAKSVQSSSMNVPATAPSPSVNPPPGLTSSLGSAPQAGWRPPPGLVSCGPRPPPGLTVPPGLAPPGLNTPTILPPPGFSGPTTVPPVSDLAKSIQTESVSGASGLSIAQAEDNKAKDHNSNSTEAIQNVLSEQDKDKLFSHLIKTVTELGAQDAQTAVKKLLASLQSGELASTPTQSSTQGHPKLPVEVAKPVDSKRPDDPNERQRAHVRYSAEELIELRGVTTRPPHWFFELRFLPLQNEPLNAGSRRQQERRTPNVVRPPRTWQEQINKILESAQGIEELVPVPTTTKDVEIQETIESAVSDQEDEERLESVSKDAFIAHPQPSAQLPSKPKTQSIGLQGSVWAMEETSVVNPNAFTGAQAWPASSYMNDLMLLVPDTPVTDVAPNTVAPAAATVTSIVQEDSTGSDGIASAMGALSLQDQPLVLPSHSGMAQVVKPTAEAQKTCLRGLGASRHADPGAALAGDGNFPFRRPTVK